MKSCPTCGTQADQSANFCLSCGGALPSAVFQRAPEPPTLLELFFKPFASQRYAAELRAYQEATGQITNKERKAGFALYVYILVLIGVAVTWVVYDNLLRK